MSKKIRLTEGVLRRIVGHTVRRCLREGLLYEHQDVVENLELAKEMVRDQWKSPDNYWYILIVERAKDNYNVRDTMGNSIFKNKKNATKKNTRIDNNVGYAIVKGDTVEEALESLMYPDVILFKDNLDIFGDLAGGNGRIVPCDRSKGEISNIKEICDATNARALMTIRRNSYKNSTTKYEKPQGRMETHFKEALLSSDGEIVGDYTILCKTLHPTKYSGKHMLLIDCDIDSDDPNTMKDVFGRIRKIMADNGVEIYKITKSGGDKDVFTSHNGYHIWVDAETENNSKLFAGSNEKQMAIKLNDILKQEFGTSRSHLGRQDGLVMMEKPSISNIILYSSVGYSDRNVESPEWAKRWGDKFTTTRRGK